VVFIFGDLDLASRERCYDASVAAVETHVHVDLGAMTFMDCGGYSAFIRARQVVEGRGGTLTWRGATGQPARLLALIPAVRGPAPSFDGSAPCPPLRHGFGS
jgi:anti-anti-sigma regulatory factor